MGTGRAGGRRGSGRGQEPLTGGTAAVTVGCLPEQIARDAGQVGGRGYMYRGWSKLDKVHELLTGVILLCRCVFKHRAHIILYTFTWPGRGKNKARIYTYIW